MKKKELQELLKDTHRALMGLGGCDLFDLDTGEALTLTKDEAALIALTCATVSKAAEVDGVTVDSLVGTIASFYKGSEARDNARKKGGKHGN